MLARRGKGLKVRSPLKRARKTSTPRKIEIKRPIYEEAGPSGLQENKENHEPVSLPQTPRRNRPLRLKALARKNESRPRPQVNDLC